MILNEINQQKKKPIFSVPLNSNPFNIYIYFVVFFYVFPVEIFILNFSNRSKRNFCKMSELFNRITILFQRRLPGIMNAVEGFAHLHFMY